MYLKNVYGDILHYYFRHIHLSILLEAQYLPMVRKNDRGKNAATPKPQVQLGQKLNKLCFMP